MTHTKEANHYFQKGLATLSQLDAIKKQLKMARKDEVDYYSAIRSPLFEREN